MSKKRVLTGVTTTGIPHLGNYVGAIRPAIRAAQADDVESFLFLADYHGIIKCHEPAMIHESTQAVAATWLACGLNPERTTFYRQSDIPEIMELNWILTCITAKGLMNRAHAYKAAVQENEQVIRTSFNEKIQEANMSLSSLTSLLKDSPDNFKDALPIVKNIVDILNFFLLPKNKIIFSSELEKLTYEIRIKFIACKESLLNNIAMAHKYGAFEPSKTAKNELFSSELIYNYSAFEHSKTTENELFTSKSIIDKLDKLTIQTQEVINFIEKKVSDRNDIILSSIDPDNEIEMGLYSYPILMTADILMFKAQEVPVGRDQIQHVEMARDIAGRFNHRFKEVFTLPEVKIDENVELLVGLDGRKMSKSYGNTIPLWENDKKTQKSVNKIVTNMKEPGEPKQPDESPLFEIYKAFATPSETAEFTQMLAEGLAWGEAKKLLAAKINAELAEPRERYAELTANPARIEEILQAGAAKARKEARILLDEVRDAVGIRALK